MSSLDDDRLSFLLAAMFPVETRTLLSLNLEVQERALL